MRNQQDRKGRNDPSDMALLAVLAASAREAEELLAGDDELDPETVAEADRRLKRFMTLARQLAR
jgi:hypothetical protein